ncbi:hypothetical protein K493DRAFT_313250 [Basidiobolus meristosporus CBS 931.73]|uniref:Radical SAM core domain-containing protein n=1 Tax=Basidiobolus meristosporus CBS 931.73 TaxID=1314790 RepID=A0A1Y1YMV5_9FUNG|nr:hypothetical protein K493DRAFT_313250 [Basidiobolus meristosporus CBS 931.73]|eukprot:ORX99370.1 hypothetical protein K493DRAFT_313250 [Basidiobolus meristosporus CBS 931.73]
MPPKRVLNPQSIFDQASVEEAFEELKIRPQHLHSLYSNLILRSATDYDEIVDFPKKAKDYLSQNYVLSTSKVIHKKVSKSGDTIKLVVRLQDGLEVESVIMFYEPLSLKPAPENDEASEGETKPKLVADGTSRRATLCISSQVGCQMACTFCATGTMGIQGNLTAAEIVEQLMHARKEADIRNVVFMGMGEPLNNYKNVTQAVKLMIDSRYFGLKPSRVTVSTVGVIPYILKLATDLPKVSLALSLHAPNQEIREQLVPSARSYRLDKLMGAIDTYQEKTGNKVFIEYVLLSGVNDLPEHIDELGELLRDRDVTVNLIPWNPIYSPEIEFSAPGAESTEYFKNTLKNKYNIRCTVRQEKGQDVSGACGQLVLETQAQRGANADCGTADIEDLMSPGAREVSPAPKCNIQ